MTKIKKLTLAISMLCLMTLLLIATVRANTVAEPDVATSITSKVTQSGNEWWTNTEVTLTNSGSSTIDLRNATIAFQSSIALPNLSINMSSNVLSWAPVQVSNVGRLNQITPNFGNNTWDITSLTPGKTLTLSFGSDKVVNITDIKVYTQNPNPKPDVFPASLKVTMPQAPVEGLTAQKVLLQDTSKGTAAEATDAPWGNDLQKDNLTDGDNYKLFLNSVDFKGSRYIPNYTINAPLNFKANHTTIKAAKITYTRTVLPAINAILNVDGLPDGQHASVVLNGDDKTQYTVNVKNGNNTITVINENYNIAPSNISFNNQTYVASTQNSIISNDNTINITYKVQSQNNNMWFAPYKDMTLNADWSDWQVGVKPNLSEIVAGSGATHFILAFLTQDSWATNTCQPSWGGNSLATTPQLGIGYGVAEIEQIRAKGGDVAISFGGENGMPVEEVCGIEGFEQVMENVQNTYHPAFIDFDVEGGNLQNAVANADRIGALKLFLQKHPNAIIQFTLPANNEGLAQDGINFLTQVLDTNTGLWAYRDNLRYNLMTMAWYAQKSPAGVEKSIEDAVAAGSLQIKTAYCVQTLGTCNYKPEDFYKSIRVTARIGVDYDGSIMQISEATTLVDYAKRIGLGGISFWSMDVDRNNNQTGSCGSSSARADCSGVEQTPYEYTQTFLRAINK